MGDYENGASFGERVQTFHHHLLVFHIERACRFIENKEKVTRPLSILTQNAIALQD